MLTDENQHQFTEQTKITREDLNMELAISSMSRVYVETLVHCNQEARFVNRVLNETYNYDIMDIRFFFCMN